MASKGVKKVARIDSFNKLIATPFKAFGDLAYVPGGAVRFAYGALKTTAGVLTFNGDRIKDGLGTMGEGTKRILAPATTAINGIVDSASTLILDKPAKPLEAARPDIKRDYLGDAWDAQKTSIKDKNAQKTAGDNLKTRMAGLGKIMYGATIGIAVETVKGAVHALHGISAVVTGAGKWTAGLVTGKKEWRENGATKMKAGLSMTASGLAAPILAPASLIGGGLYNLATGHEATRTYENLKKAEELTLKQGAGKFNAHKDTGTNADLTMSVAEQKFIENMQDTLSKSSQTAGPTPNKKPRSTAKGI